ncbi:MAG: hypothetical protein PHW64_05190 [Sulfuricurvum sp.]|nr:hypothetical protein [Sulfuricurvum sp.]
MILSPLRLIAFSLILGGVLYGHSLSEKELVSYEEGKKLYAAKSYAEAYTIFSSLYLNALDDTELNFYMGRSAYEIKEYPAALAAYERVLFLDPENLYNQLELARTQHRLGLLDEAKTNFETILATPDISVNMRKTIEYYLASIAKQQQRSFFFLTAKGGFLYDSNVNFGSSDATYTLPSYGIYPTSTPSSDGAHEETATLTHLYDVGERGGAVIRNKVSLYNRSYTEQRTYDMLLFSYYPSLSYASQNSIYDLIGGVDYFELGLNRFYKGYSLNPRWSYRHTPALRHIVSFKAGEKNHYVSSDLDAKTFDLSGGIEYAPYTARVLRTDLIASRQIKEGGSRRDVSYREYGVNFLYNHQLFPRTLVQINGNLKKRFYDECVPSFLSYRNDTTRYGAINIVQRLNNAVSIEAAANYTRTDSTLSIYSYDKYILSMSLSGRF